MLEVVAGGGCRGHTHNRASYTGKQIVFPESNRIRHRLQVVPRWPQSSFHNTVAFQIRLASSRKSLSNSIETFA